MNQYNSSSLPQWFDPRLEVRKSKISGKGIFAKGFIQENEILMIWGGHIFTSKEIKERKAKPNSISGYKEGLFLGQPVDGEDTIDQFLNHSCEPNVWMLDELQIAARRNINMNEEITADYAFWELEPNWKLKDLCNCGSISCRKNITGNDWKIFDLQKKYANHFLPCLNERIRKLQPRWGFVQAWQDFVMYFQMHFLSQIMRNVLNQLFLYPLLQKIL